MGARGTKQTAGNPEATKDASNAALLGSVQRKKTTSSVQPQLSCPLQRRTQGGGLAPYKEGQKGGGLAPYKEGQKGGIGCCGMLLNPPTNGPPFPAAPFPTAVAGCGMLLPLVLGCSLPKRCSPQGPLRLLSREQSAIPVLLRVRVRARARVRVTELKYVALEPVCQIIRSVGSEAGL